MIISNHQKKLVRVKAKIKRKHRMHKLFYPKTMIRYNILLKQIFLISTISTKKLNLLKIDKSQSTQLK